jgi:carbamoyl-phosphate synthase large subunit
MREQVRQMALALGVRGLMNVQFASGRPHLRARGQSARLAHRALCVQGHRRAAGQGRRALHGRADPGEQGFTKEVVPGFYSVKEAVLPFNKFPGVDPILGPEMKSTGEVMGTGPALPMPSARHSSPPASRPRAAGRC